MGKLLPASFVISVSLFVALGLYLWHSHTKYATGAPPYGEAREDVPADLNPYAWLKDWKRPDGPPRVGFQVGHYKNNEFPDELEKLRGNTGAQGGGKSEWEANLRIAQETQQILQNHGITVDILPATVPVKYWADAFIAIHADGSENAHTTGFKIAGPWRDFTNRSSVLVNYLERSYAEATGLSVDPNISRNMRGYYAFSWWRYNHAIHPMTTAVIVETGFLTSPHDRRIIVDQPQLPAAGLAQGIIDYLKAENLLD